MNQDIQLTMWCAIEYLRQSCDQLSTPEGPIVLIILQNSAGKLRLLTAPQLEAMIDQQDWSYIQELFRDLTFRARSAPEMLFQQMSSLAVGPLRTKHLCSTLADYPEIRESIDKFVEVSQLF